MEQSTSKKRPAPRGTAAYPRKRAVTACQTCRARRTKCDNQRPKCSFCQKTGAQCIQSPVDLSSFDPASLHIIQRLEDLETNLQTTIREERLQTLGADDLRSSSRGPDPSLRREFLLPVEPEQLYDVIRLETPQTSLWSLVTSSTEQANLTPSSAHASGFETDLDGPTCRRLLDSFFRYVHVKNPILQEDDTRRIVHHVSMNGLDWSARCCLVLLICALGATATPFGPSENVAPGTTAFRQGESYFAAARKRLGSCLIDGGLLGAQCLFLAGVYLANNFKGFESWRLFSQSLACCQTFRFDTPATDLLASPGVSPQSADEAAKQSIYWSAWKSEHEIRMAFPMRDFPASSESVYPFFLPTPPASSPEPGILDEQQARERLGWYFYLTEISLHRMNKRIANETLSLRPKAGQSILTALADALPEKELEVENWLNALPSPMSSRTDPIDDDICKFVLRGHLYNFYELIYWPFIARYILAKNHNFDSSRNSDEEVRSTQLAEASLALHAERIRINAPGFQHRHHGTWGMIRSCTRSALVLLKAATSTALTMPSEWLEAVNQVIDLNRYWQQEAPDSPRHLAILEQAVGLL